MVVDRLATAAPPRPAVFRRTDVAFATAAFLLPLALYLRTLAPDVMSADGGEFQFVPHVLGIAHPTGYPLYTLLGKAFSTIPFGSVAFRMNLMSAVIAAAASSVTYLIGVYLVGQSHKRPSFPAAQHFASRLAALCGATALAVSATWWSLSTITSVRTLTGLFVALCLLLALRWAADPRPSWLNWLAFAFGLSLTHHVTMWSLAPAFLLFVLVVDRRALASGRQLLSLAWRLALPLLLYLYLPIRSALGAPFDLAHPTTVNAFLDVVLARGFGDAMFYFGWQSAPERLELLRELLLAEFGWPGLALAAVGIAGAAFTARRALLLLGTVAAANALVSLTYNNAQTAGYMIPALIAIAALIGLGVWTLARLFAKLLDRMPARQWQAAALMSLAALIVPLQVLGANFESLDRSGDRESRAFAVAALEAAAPGSTILADWHDATPLWYLQLIEGRRRDVDVRLILPQPDRFPRDDVMRMLGANVPVYLTAYHRQIAPSYRLRAVGPLLQILAGPEYAEPVPGPDRSYVPVGANLDGKVMLLGYAFQSQNVAPGDKVRLTLYWKALEKMDQAYTVFVQVPRSDGGKWGQLDGYPVKGTRPTNGWDQGEVVADEREIALAPDTPPGRYPVIVGMYEIPAPGQWRKLPIVGGSAGADTVALDGIEVLAQAKPVVPPQFPTDFRFGDLARLVGVDVNHWSGRSMGITLYWQVERPTAENLSVGLNFRDSRRVDVGQHSSWPLSGLRPTSQWVPGELVIDRHEVELPKEPSGNLDLQVKLLKESGQEIPTLDGRPAIVALPQGLDDPGKVRVNFDNKALLVGWRLDPAAVRPGGATSVILEWQPLQGLTGDSALNDASVFVHLLGKDGRTWGQADGGPVFGGYPTQTWIKGRIVHDRHVLKLDPGVPPGEYTLAVGMYVTRVGERWPVLDRKLMEAGQADRFLLGPLSVQPLPQ